MNVFNYIVFGYIISASVPMVNSFITLSFSLKHWYLLRRFAPLLSFVTQFRLVAICVFWFSLTTVLDPFYY